MSLDAARQFLSKVDSDADFYLQLGEAPSREERWEVVRSAGFDFSKGELTQAMGELDAGKMTEFFVKGWGTIFGDVPRPERVGLDEEPRCGTCE